MTADAYTQAEVARRARQITDRDVATFYQANSAQMQGRSLEQMTPAITRFLQEQEDQAARLALMSRATDARGRVQPATRDADRRNYMVNHILPVEVQVR